MGTCCSFPGIAYLYMQRHPGADPPAQLMNMSLPPFPFTVAQTLDITQLGYSYAVQAVP
jgi:tyrosinase